MKRLLLSCLLCLLFCDRSLQAATPTYDLVVYGATASGVMTAYSAAQQGLHVVILEPGGHVGGMVTGGLSATDLGHFEIIGGYARKFYLEAAKEYGYPDLSKAAYWMSEPHVDERIFLDWLSKAHVEVRFHERLREKGGVVKQGASLQSIVTEDGKSWTGKVFADCSYEGDLMAQSKVSLRLAENQWRSMGRVLRAFGRRRRSTNFAGPSRAMTRNIIYCRGLIPGQWPPRAAGTRRCRRITSA